MSVAAILGSSFTKAEVGGHALASVSVSTPFGPVTLYRYPGKREAYCLFRHGVPHRFLPHQIPYQAQAAALREVGCKALLVTSSVGVMTADVPLFQPLVVSDLFMPENRLPDGSACTLFTAPTAKQGHLVLDEGLCSQALGAQLDEFVGSPLPRVIFAYVGGPRTKTAAENRWLATTGAQVNSMTVGPELVLANELEIPTAVLVVGHKYSLPDTKKSPQVSSDRHMTSSLESAKDRLERLIVNFLERGEGVPFKNHIYRFG